MALGLAGTSLFSDGNLVAYYELEDRFDSKASFDLTEVGSPVYSPARFNNGVDLGASNSTKALKALSNLGIDGGAMSISLWVKNLTEIGSGNYVFAYQFNDTSKVEYSINYEYNGGTRRILFKRGRVGTEDKIVTFNVTMGTSNQFHCVLTHNGSTLEGYVDDSSKGTIAATGNGTAGSGNSFDIGAKNDATTQFASSIIDDVGVFSDALTSGEVTTLFNSPTQVDESLFIFPTDTPSIGRSYEIVEY